LIPGPKVPRTACAAAAAAAAVMVVVWTSARIHYVFDGNWTALFCTGAKARVPPDLEAETYRFPGTGGYDGQFYRYLAYDPFLWGDYTRYMDAPQLRSRRILVPLLAWMCAFGQRTRIDGAYIAVEMLFLGLGVYWCARLLARRGRSPAWGLLFVTLPATLASFDRMLVDGPLAALFAGFMLYCEEERWDRVWVLAALASLTRETGLLLIAALVAFHVYRRAWRRVVQYGLGALPTIVWYAYLTLRLHRDAPGSILAIPAWGLLRRLLVFRHDPDPGVELLVRVTDVLAVIGLAVCIALAVIWVIKAQPMPVTFSVGLFAALALVLGAPSHMIEAFGFSRPVSPLLLWIMLEAVSRGAWAALAPPLLVSLSASLTFGGPLIAIIKGLAGR
jgi:hypothetical protein